MRRREFITLLGGTAVGALTGRRHARAQTRQRPLIGTLSGSSEDNASINIGGFLQGLREHGYVEGRNIDVVSRYADGDVSRQPALAEELIALRPDVIVTANTGATIAVKQRSTIPIVSPSLDDPIGFGLVNSLARPGGQVTGVLFTIDTLPGKQLQLALELVPGASKAGVLLNTASETGRDLFKKAAEAAAAELKIELVPVEVRLPAELDEAFAALARNRPDVLLVLPNPLFSSEGERIAALAAKARLPALSAYRPFPRSGGLASYGIDLRENHRRVADFVDRILKGEKPGDLPIELPTRFEMAINLRTAHALGLTIPTSILLRADEVIE